ncbi:isoaspartyl peptidase/L-asparaginase family protein [Parvularcula sp. LCG005]|uniref:isoaspartyl peptidase/L-asparaginase family protein n=1 Tax=Parvularcula sp. LCG005 TaxID=3078805 RepID=UPI0029433ADB|nr:isoaspartyl peptidase/L-asparaginase [Parvularcula sp. LCG005]WOI53213.1 isoaspartyl peptidase/L-asparaginase [Parvularcula sp. LCG005]
MKALIALALSSTILGWTSAGAAGGPCKAQDNFTIVAHGGTARKGPEPAARLVFLKKILGDARRDLRNGATALDTVETTIELMENSGLFNAGRGAISNEAGFVETDASIMDGRTMNAGSIASMTRIRNPITGARLVMDETRHVMMVGDRGEEAVLALGAAPAPADYFLRNRQSDEPEEHGTVGVAVLDRCGNLAAGTSTGGYDAKIPGRVGDSPVIGAGVYAKNNVIAGSATGHGEYFIRYTALRSVAARVEYGGMPLEEAAGATIAEMAVAGGGQDGRGGVVTVDARGNFAMPFSSEGMVRGYATQDERARVGAFGTVD